MQVIMTLKEFVAADPLVKEVSKALGIKTPSIDEIVEEIQKGKIPGYEVKQTTGEIFSETLIVFTVKEAGYLQMMEIICKFGSEIVTIASTLKLIWKMFAGSAGHFRDAFSSIKDDELFDIKKD